MRHPKHRFAQPLMGAELTAALAGAVAGAAVAYYLIEQSKRKGVAMFSAWKKKRPSVEPVITARACRCPPAARRPLFDLDHHKQSRMAKWYIFLVCCLSHRTAPNLNRRSVRRAG